MAGEIILVLGGARSGKSSFAEKLAASSGGRVTYLAAADSKDEEMKLRIERHRESRPSEWETWEGEPEEIADAIKSCRGTMLFDCLTMWLTRLFLKEDLGEKADENLWDAREAEIRKLAVEMCGAVGEGSRLIIVSNEVGFGLVPPYKMGRRFRDLQGRMNQLCASKASHVALVVAGCPLWIKGGEL